MAYTTAQQVKRELPFNYQRTAERKLTEDGFIDAAGNFSELSFLNFFIDQQAAFIDGYLAGTVGTPPFAANGVLDKINKALAVYEVETYLISATSDRVVSVSIYAMYQWAMRTLDKILNGDITLLPAAGGAADSGTVKLIEPDNDGETLVIGVLESDILMNGKENRAWD